MHPTCSQSLASQRHLYMDLFRPAPNAATPVRPVPSRRRPGEKEVRRLPSYGPKSEMLISELGCAAYYEHHYEEAARYCRPAQRIRFNVAFPSVCIAMLH
jgi:hypothetical protein